MEVTEMPGDDSLFENALARQLPKIAGDGEGEAARSRDGGEANAGGDLAAAQSNCLDAEILAAYHERTLGSEEMNGCKEHIAACGRCQEILAQLEATDEVFDEGSEEFELAKGLGRGKGSRGWARPAMLASAAQAMPREVEMPPMAAPIASAGRAAPEGQAGAAGISGRETKRTMWMWAAPAGAVAAALVLWMGWHGRSTAMLEKSAVQVAEDRTQPEGTTNEPTAPTAALPSATPSASAPAPPPVRRSEGAARGKAAVDMATNRGPEEKEALTRKAGGARAASPALAQKAMSGAPGYGSGIARRAAVAPTEKVATAPALDAAVPQATSANVEVSNQTTPLVTSDAKVASKVPNIPETVTVAGASTPIATESAQQKGADAGGALMEYQAVPLNGRNATSMRKAYKASALDAHLIPAPGGNVIWRVGFNGQIEHSTDGGKSWTQQSSGVKTELLSGSAPSEAVCWAVGRAGTILQSVDGGAHWTKVAPPVGVDMGGIRAADGLHAVVWDSTNRDRFATSDGGVTWTRVANK
jgi:hypothetical protein